MPTNKKTVSLLKEDLAIITQLRQLVERNENRYSLAEMIRKCIQYTYKHQQDFNKDFF